MHFKKKENYFQNCFWDFQEFEKRTIQLKEEGGEKGIREEEKREEGGGKGRREREERRREEGGGKRRKEEGRREEGRREVGREKVREVSVCEENGDFCVISKGYLSVYTVNGVLIATVSRKMEKIAKFETCLIIQVNKINSTPPSSLLCFFYRIMTVMKMTTFYQVILMAV